MIEKMVDTSEIAEEKVDARWKILHDVRQNIVASFSERDGEVFANVIFEECKKIIKGDFFIIFGNIIVTGDDKYIIHHKSKNIIASIVVDRLVRTGERLCDVLRSNIFDDDETLVYLENRQQIDNKFSTTKLSNNIKSLLIAPIKWEHRIAAAIVMHSDVEDTYKGYYKIIEALADSISGICEHRRNVNRKHFVIALNKHLHISDDVNKPKKQVIDEIMENAHNYISQYLNAKKMLVYEYIDNETLQLLYATNEILKPVKLHDPIMELVQEVIKSPNKRFHYNTRNELKSIYDKYEDNIESPESLMILPMRLDESNVFGVFILFHHKPFTYDNADYDFVNDISDQIAIIIDNINSRTGYQESVTFYDALIKSVNHISTSISKVGLTEEQILTETYSHIEESEIIKIISETSCYIAIYDRKNNKINFPVFFEKGINIIEEKGEGFYNREFGDGRTEWIIKHKKEILIKTKEESIDWYSKIGTDYIDDPLASWLGVPIIVGEEVVGVIAIFHTIKDNLYEKKHLEILSTLSGFVGVAIENARLQKRFKELSHTVAQNQDVLTRALTARDLAHRLNNLAGTIPIWIGEVEEALNEKELDYADIRHCLGRILKDTKALLEEVNNLSNPELEKEFNFSDMLKALLEQIEIQQRDNIREERLKIKFKEKYDQVKVFGHYSSLAHAIFVILDNGVDAILEKGDGILTVDTYCFNKDGKNWQEITIQDTGCGISESNKNKIFELDFSTKGFGHGYGLWRANQVIKTMGGKISFTSDEGNETAFTITFPIKSY